MKTSFDIKEGKWKIAWPQRISQHDLVCLSPPLDPMQGLPIGNGDIGVLVWCEPRRLVLAVNKCDIWDDLPDKDLGKMTKDAPHWEDYFSTPRHACRMELDLVMPLMDSWYLTDFEARLDIARGMATISSVTPLGKFYAEIFVSQVDKAVVLNYTIDTKEPICPRVVVERWGSRTFNGWYNQHQPDASIGLNGTNVAVNRNTLVLTQKLRKMSFAVTAITRDKKKDVAPCCLHSRSGIFYLSSGAQHAGQAFLTVVTSEEASDPVLAANQLLAKIKNKSFVAVKNAHIHSWRDFWRKSGSIMIDDKFLEMFWHLTIYYAASSQRGRYPGIFTQALWSWNRDFQPWGGQYFHWNQQQLCWPVSAAGHPELMKPYLEFRYNMLDRAKKTAAAIGKKGAFFADVASRLGQQHRQLNRTPGGQIAALFWTYYRYSGDKDYLRAKGWPVIEAVAQWHYDILEKKEDGLYHGTPAWAYEGGNMLRDCITELVTARKTFEIAIAAARVLNVAHPELERWQDALNKLAHLVTMESPLNPGVKIFAAGYQKGIEKDAGKRVPFKEGTEEEWRNPKPTCCHDPKSWGQIFPGAETSPVFPAGLIGLKDKGNKNFALAEATAAETNTDWTGPMLFARLGQGARMKKEIAQFLKNGNMNNWNSNGFRTFNWTWYNNDATAFMGAGFFVTGKIANALKAPPDYATKDVNGPDWDAFKQSRIPVRMWEFRHIYQEPTYTITAAINESLLQSYDGIIRVAPAVTAEDSFAFTLSAEGGFLVSAQGKGEHIDFIHILSQNGGECCVAKPWKEKTVFVQDIAENVTQEMHGGEISFPTECARAYLLTPEQAAADTWHCIAQKPEKNKGPRKYANGNTILGIPRLFVSNR